MSSNLTASANSINHYSAARWRKLLREAIELLESARALRAGKVGRVTVARGDGQIVESPVGRIRIGTGLSQSRFAQLLGVSVRTLQQWEQGRREPTGAARTLLRVAERHPHVLQELMAA